MIESRTIHSKADWDNWFAERRKHYDDFDGEAIHWIHFGKFPFTVLWIDTESNGYSTVAYDIQYPSPLREDEMSKLFRLAEWLIKNKGECTCARRFEEEESSRPHRPNCAMWRWDGKLGEFRSIKRSLIGKKRAKRAKRATP